VKLEEHKYISHFSGAPLAAGSFASRRLDLASCPFRAALQISFSGRSMSVTTPAALRLVPQDCK
jgi:hypothetical protein